MKNRKFQKTHSVHQYRELRNSRGQRCLSKLHKGLDCGNIEKAFDEVKELNTKNDKERI